MKSLKFKRTVSLAAVATLVLSTQAHAVCVEPTGADGCETTIQAGVDATPAGGTVEVRKGLYFETVTVPAEKVGLTIIGEGSKKTRVKADPMAESNEDAFSIEDGADNVTIAELAIEQAASDGIDSDADGITIRGVLVAAADRDCLLLDGIGNTIEDSVLIGCGSGGIDNDGAGLVIRDVRLERIGDDCVVADNADNAVIEDVEARLCGGDYGFELDGNDIRLENSSVQGAAGEECLNFSGDRAVVRGNTFSICENENSVSGAAPIVEKNTIIGPFSSGLRVDCESACEDARVVKNKVIDAGFRGLRVSADAGEGMLVSGNQVSGAKGEALNISGDVGIVVVKNKVSNSGAGRAEGIIVAGIGHRLEKNQVSGQNGDGFLIEGSNITLVKNLAKGNLADGFRVASSAGGVIFEGNKAIGNLGLGFQVDAGADTTTFTKNIASKNRTDFCDEGTATTNNATNKFKTTGGCGID